MSLQTSLNRAGSAAALVLAHIVFGSSALAVTCTENVPPTNPDHFYRIETIGGVEVVRDTRNDLMWKRDLELGEFSLGEAQRRAANANDAGFRDWRLPTIEELKTLVERCRTRARINYSIFRGDYQQPQRSGTLVHGESPLFFYFSSGEPSLGDSRHRITGRLVRTVPVVDLAIEREQAAAAVAQKIQDTLSEGERAAVASAPKLRAFPWRTTGQHPAHSSMDRSTRSNLDTLLQRALLSAYNVTREGVAVVPDVMPIEPREADFRRPLTVRERGEFETTAAFEALKRDTQAAHDASVKQAYVAAMQAYQTTQRTYQQNVARQQQAKAAFESRMETPAGWAPLLNEAWKEVVAKHLGDPVLTDVSYDADKQVFNAMLRSSMGTFSKPVVAPVPIDRAQAMKADLVSGKIAPAVSLRFPGPEATWELVENDALRQRRFSEANNSVAELESLIVEYPLSAEAKSARTRIFQVPNTSKELIAVTSRLSSWAEASTGRARLREVQMAEWKAAEAKKSSAVYKNFIDNFAGVDSQNLLALARSARQMAEASESAEERRAEVQRQRERAQWEADAPRREARRLCEAQVSTCIASCPRDRVFRTQADTSCSSRCSSVSCS